MADTVTLWRIIKALLRRSEADLDMLAALWAPRLLKAALSSDEATQSWLPQLANRLLNQPRIWGDAGRLTLGVHVYPNNALFNTTSGTILVEDYVFFGHDVSLLTGTHDIQKRNLDRMWAVPPEGRDIVIRSGAWIASGATILGPCEIGAHAVIGAGSLVTGEVKPGWFYAGTPARPISKIEFQEEGV